MALTLRNTTIRGTACEAWTPSTLFAAGEQGFWYDPSDIPINWRRNLLTYTEQFDNAYWTKSNVTVSANVGVAPDGTTTADGMLASTTGASLKRFSVASTVVSGSRYTESVFAKAGLATTVVLRFDSSNFVLFDLSAVTATVTGTYYASASITSAGSGWYRCVGVLTTTSTSHTTWIGPSDLNTTYASTIDPILLLWGAQLEAGSVATTYQRIITPEISFLEYKPQPVMFQESTGVTPVWGVEQAVGLILDEIRGLALSLMGTTPLNSASWTLLNGATRTASSVTGINNGDALSLTGFVVGRTYKITADVASSTGSWRWLAEGTGTNYLTNIVTGTSYFVATSTGLLIYCITGGTITFNSVRVESIAGNHAIQPTAASRPTLRARYNLLTYSEQFDNAAWSKVDGTSPSSAPSVATNTGTAPDGTNTADTVTFTAAPNNRIEQSANTALNGETLTFYVWMKGSGTITLSVGTSTGVGGSQDSTITLTSSWVRYSVSVTLSSPTGNRRGLIIFRSGNTATAVDVWGADLRTGNDTYLPYQRIAAATDYDTVGFPPYLAFDGSDDSLYTGGNVDFSATDKMTVWAGVTKLSDAATAMVVELSADAGTNAGAFQIRAPNTAAANYLLGVRGSVAQDNITATTYAAPVTNVLTHNGDLSAASSARVDGVAFSGAGGTGGGNYGSYPLYIGRRNNASLPFNGRIYSLIGRGAATTAPALTQAENWVATKQGRTP